MTAPVDMTAVLAKLNKLVPDWARPTATRPPVTGLHDDTIPVLISPGYRLTEDGWWQEATAFEEDFFGYFTDDQPPKVGVLALVAVGCWVAAGMLVLGVVGAVRGLCRWTR